MSIAPKDFSNKHWELLVYVDTRCTDHHGQLEDGKIIDELNDLIAAGYCQNVGSYLVPTMVMTDLGYQVLEDMKKSKQIV